MDQQLKQISLHWQHTEGRSPAFHMPHILLLPPGYFFGKYQRPIVRPVQSHLTGLPDRPGWVTQKMDACTEFIDQFQNNFI